jgi:hypothetical protein
MDADEQSQLEEKRSDPSDSGPGAGHAEGEPPDDAARRLRLADEDVARLARQIAEENDRLNRTVHGIVLPAYKADQFRKVLAGEPLFPQGGASKKDRAKTARCHVDAFSHNDDYTFVTLRGESFLLKGRCSEIIRILDTAQLHGHPDVRKDKIAVDLNCDASRFRVSDSFRGQPGSYKALIKSNGKGFYRLNV